MTKNAASKFPIHKIIGERWSPHGFSTKLPDREQLQSIFEAARWAPSSQNSQPWRFMIFNRNNPDTFDSLIQSLNSDDRDWAKYVPILILVLAKSRYDNSEMVNRYARFETGMAVQNILLQATELDLVARPMAGYSPRKVRQAFDMPDEFEVMVAIAIGYEGDISTLSEKHQKISRASRQRKPLEGTVSFNRFIIRDS